MNTRKKQYPLCLKLKLRPCLVPKLKWGGGRGGEVHGPLPPSDYTLSLTVELVFVDEDEGYDQRVSFCSSVLTISKEFN